MTRMLIAATWGVVAFITAVAAARIDEPMSMHAQPLLICGAFGCWSSSGHIFWRAMPYWPMISWKLEAELLGHR